jgi:hypothetical protein
MKRRRTRGRFAAIALLVASLLAGCDAANAPRGGPQLPSTPAFLNPSGDSGTPTPSAADQALPLPWLPLGWNIATLNGVVHRPL